MCEDPCGWGDSFEERGGAALEAGTALEADTTLEAARTPGPAQACPAQGPVLGPERGHRLTDWRSLSNEILLLPTVVISECWGEGHGEAWRALALGQPRLRTKGAGDFLTSQKILKESFGWR